MTDVIENYFDKAIDYERRTIKYLREGLNADERMLVEYNKIIKDTEKSKQYISEKMVAVLDEIKMHEFMLNELNKKYKNTTDGLNEG